MEKLLVLALFVVGSLAFAPRPDSKLSWRVVGGSDAPDGAHPHQISMRLYNSSHNCGGSIVDNEWIITAAHCVRGASIDQYTVVAGTNKLNSGGTYRSIVGIHIHEKHNPSTGENDIALLKVEPFTYTDKIRPILAETEDVGGDVPVTLSGWGRLNTGGAIPNNLQEIELKTTTVEYCRSRHTVRPVYESSICTLTKIGEGACHGDSGGPLTTNIDGVRKLVGIVSWGQPCARGYPDVYARVSSYVDWVNEKCNNCLNKGKHVV